MTENIDYFQIAPPIAEVVEYLHAKVGPRMTAALVGATEILGEEPYPALVERRLREGARAIALVEVAFGSPSAWLFGLNMMMDTLAPVTCLAKATTDEEFQVIYEAAKSLVGSWPASWPLPAPAPIHRDDILISNRPGLDGWRFQFVP